MATSIVQTEARSASGSLARVSKAADALARGVTLYEQGERLAAAPYLERAVQLDPGDGSTNLGCRAATYLGVIQVEEDHLDQALHWLKQAQAAVRLSPPGPWFSLLLTLTSLGQAQAAAQVANQRLAETRAQLAEEIRLLRTEVSEVTADLLRELKRDSTPSLKVVPRGSHLGAFPPSETEKPFLKVRLLGMFDLRLDSGESIPLCSNHKGQIVFMLLATRPEVRWHKEKLLALLWPEENPAIAAGKLHVAISRLRSVLLRAGLGRDAILFEDDCYCLNRELHTQSDVVLFDSRFRAGRRLEAMDEPDLAAAEYEAGLTLYQGAYLAEVVGEEWPLAERARLEDQFLVLLTQLATWYFDKGRYVQSIECCRRILERDNLREDIYCQLMRCLSRDGLRNQALQTYRSCEQVLREELGVEPLHETIELAERIRHEQAV